MDESKGIRRLRKQLKTAWETADHYRREYERENQVSHYYAQQIVFLSKDQEEMIIRLVRWDENPEKLAKIPEKE